MRISDCSSDVCSSDLIQADEAYRSSPEGIENLYVRGTSGEMAPFRAFSTLSWKTAPVILSRYNGKPAMQLQGAPGQGLSTGDAMNAITEMHGKLPTGAGLEWNGRFYEGSLRERKRVVSGGIVKVGVHNGGG